VSSIQPEHWHLLPTVPKFGSLIDPFGGRIARSEKVKQAEKPEPRMDTLRETLIGMVEIHSDEEGLFFMAHEIGLVLSYEKSGQLTEVQVDLYDFFMSRCNGPYGEKSGGKMHDVLEDMVDNGDNITVYADIKDKTVTVVNDTEGVDEGKVMAFYENFDCSKTTMAEIKYGDYSIVFGLLQVEDTLCLGIFALGRGETAVPSEDILTGKILNDCNYKTFLESRSPEKYERLVKRIFFS
jgi:hypothetical protein